MVSAGACVLLLVSLNGAAAARVVAPLPRPPPLALVQDVLLTTAKEDFSGSEDVCASAFEWQHQRFYQRAYDGKHEQQQPYPFLACVGPGNARQAFSRLDRELLSAPGLFRRISIRDEHGACFFVTMGSHKQAAAVSEGLADLQLLSFAPFPAALKLAPGLLDFDVAAAQLEDAGKWQQKQQQEKQQHPRLTTTHGENMRRESVGGLHVELSPGVLPADTAAAGAFISDLIEGLLSTSVDLHTSNFWSDVALDDDGADGRRAHPASAARVREWTRAADVVHGLSSEGGPTPGDVCSWSDLIVRPAGSDALVITEIDHLLVGGRGAGGSAGEEAEELQMACFMGLVSYLASRPQVLRVGPFHMAQLMNAVAKAISESGTITDTPLADEGLDGTGEVIQVVDSGLDQESCYFREADGQQVEGGYFFDGVWVGENGIIPIFTGGSFPFDLDRRKIVQYISLVRVNLDVDTDPYITPGGAVYGYYSGSGFYTEISGGHGSHTAGTAAGAMLDSPPELSCAADEDLGCLGGCFATAELEELASNSNLEIETFCPAYSCDGLGTKEEYPMCLDDPLEGLPANSGVAPGAKIAVFDVIDDDDMIVWAFLAGNGLWDATENTGAKVHSSSWGTRDLSCAVDSTSLEHDTYMYENPEHLLLFAAGNSGDQASSACTIGSPAIAKNVLAVGASSSGSTRFAASATGLDSPDIDTVAFFSSYGPSADGRIKPEIVAPGNQVLSVLSSGGSGPTCALELQAGTSMATPVVAASAAKVRQYFKDSAFYVTDLESRGLCSSNSSSPFICGEFGPSAATVKAVLINGADLMGGSPEPDGYRGFGRVQLQDSLPLRGIGNRALLVVDSSDASVAEGASVEYTFNTDGSSDNAGEMRATLAWIDPPTSTMSSKQLLHDLDLIVTGPSGTKYTMWSNGDRDSSNVIERVIISAADFAAEGSGKWTVSVSAGALSTDSQSYSLVIWGPFGNGTISVEDGLAPVSAASPCRGLASGILSGLSLMLALPLLARAGGALAA